MSSYTTLMMIVLATILATTMAAENNSTNGTGIGMTSYQQNPMVLLTLALVPVVARIFA